jgi:hypothetical protein
MSKHFLFGFALFIVGISGCKKEVTSFDCEKLKVEMASNHVEGVKTIINQMIDRLSSKQYTEKNLKDLVNRLKNQCSLSADTFCFDCIQTLPSQTEIQIDFSLQGNTVRKIIDITYSINNQMVFGNMHD